MDPMIGQVILFAGTYAPRGWAFCYGQLLPIAQNSALFSLLGTYYGGDGRNTFGLPDLRGRVLMGSGQGPGLTSRSQGQLIGSETNTLNVSQLPPHTHQGTFNNSGSTAIASVNASSAEGDQSSAAGNYWAAGSNGSKPYTNNTDESMASNAVEVGIQVNGDIEIGNTGNGSPVNNIQPSLVMNYIIATTGYYPARP